MSETRSYIKSLLIRNGKHAGTDRKAWSISLQNIWLPFFTATNAVGDTAIAPDALGYPIRLAYDKDGSVKFSKAGRPVTKVTKELAENVRLVRENFVAGLVNYAEAVATDEPEAFANQVESAKLAGEPIRQKDNQSLADAQAVAMEKAMQEAVSQSTVKPKAKRKNGSEVVEPVEAVA